MITEIVAVVCPSNYALWRYQSKYLDECCVMCSKSKVAARYKLIDPENSKMRNMMNLLVLEKRMITEIEAVVYPSNCALWRYQAKYFDECCLMRSKSKVAARYKFIEPENSKRRNMMNLLVLETRMVIE